MSLWDPLAADRWYVFVKVQPLTRLTRLTRPTRPLRLTRLKRLKRLTRFTGPLQLLHLRNLLECSFSFISQ